MIPTMKIVDVAQNITECTICWTRGRIKFSKYNHALAESWYCSECTARNQPANCGYVPDEEIQHAAIDVIRTSSFWKSGEEPNAVSIARRHPDSFSGAEYLKLAPSWELVNAYKRGQITTEEYTKIYQQVLSQLNPADVVAELGPNPILLCWEAPSKFCHRHLVADWLMHTGFAVSELV